MDFSLGSGETGWRDRVRAFMDEQVRPRAPDYDAQQRAGERWKVLPIIEELKEKARSEGLWNLFMPPSHGAAHVDDSFAFDRPAGRQPQAAVDDPGAARRAGRDHQAPPAGVRLRRCAPRPYGNRARRRAGAALEHAAR